MLLKDDEVHVDPWISVDDTEDVPEQGDVCVSIERLQRDHNRLFERIDKVGVALNPDQPVDVLAPFVERLSLIALRFPVFTDGRAYSTARVLRQRFNYCGEVRARGNVLADQYAFMRQCGFDAFEIDGHQPLDLWLQAANAMSLSYQRGVLVYGGARSILNARLQSTA